MCDLHEAANAIRKREHDRAVTVGLYATLAVLIVWGAWGLN